MHSTKTLVSIALCLASLRLAEAFASPMNPQAQEAAPSAMAKRIGAIKAIEGSTLTEAETAAARLTPFLWPAVEVGQQYYFNTQAFSR